jgi:arylsulfatase A-like enzyme
VILDKNVIIILIDGGRVDRARRSSIFTNLQAKSVFFPQTITYAPYTNAAMHALFSGSYGNRNGTYSYWHTYRFKKNKFKTITEYFKDRGYFTCGDAHTELIVPKQGFDEFYIHDENKDDLSKHHSNLIDLVKTKNDQGNSFFLYLTYSNIHTGIKNEVLKTYNNFSKEYFQNKTINEKRYDGFFNKAENYLEIILKKIQDLGLYKNSIILVISDHGISIGEKFGEKAYGVFCYDYTIKTFAYLISNDLTPREISSQVRHIDFMPTILDLMKIKSDPLYELVDGKSLIPLINGLKFEENIAYSETGNPLHDKAPPKAPNTKSVRTSKWKLIFNEYNNTKELYDLENDPDENNNLIGKNPSVENFLWNELTKVQGIK